MTGVTLGTYNAALRDGQLLVAKCASCGAQQSLPSDSCFACGSEELRSTRHDGAGRVFSWVVNHYAFDAEHARESPYTVVLVTLEGGARVYGRFEPGPGAARPRADMPVVLDAEATAARGCPVYRPA